MQGNVTPIEIQFTDKALIIALAQYARANGLLKAGRYSFEVQIDARNKNGVLTAIAIPKNIKGGMDVDNG